MRGLALLLLAACGSYVPCDAGTRRETVCVQCAPNDACAKQESRCLKVCSSQSECAAGEGCIGGVCRGGLCG